MKFKLITEPKFLFLYIVAILFSSCIKQHDVIPSIIDKPSSLAILSVNKKDINKFVVTFKIKTDSIMSFDDYGLIISKDSINSLEKGRIFAFGKLSNISEKIDSCLLDSLESYVVYNIKIFVKKQNRTFLSTNKTISVDGLKIIEIGSSSKEGPFASRGVYLDIYTNFIESNENTKETKVKIGGINVNDIVLYGNMIRIIVPKNLTAGKKSIEISRNGLTLTTSDTLEILRGRYEELNDFPFEYRSHFGACQIGDIGYMIGGSIYEMSGPFGWHNDILTYDINKDRWSTTNYVKYPKDFIIQHETFTVDNKIYAIPGRDTSSYTTALESTGRIFEFDPLANKWTEKSPFPGSTRLDISGFVIKNKIYIFGGNSYGPLIDLWEYTPATDKWIRKADFPGTNVIFPAVFSYNDKAYIFGGIFPPPIVTNEFWEYDVNTNTWIQIELDKNIHERYRSVSFTIGSKGYILGGYYKSSSFGGDYALYDSWEIDLITKKWNRIADYVIPPNLFNFSAFYAKSTSFIKNNSAIIYHNGKMIRFTSD